MYYGCLKEKNDKRDYKMYVCSHKPSSIPYKYEINTPDVKDQGIVNSCVAHSLALIMEKIYETENIKFSTGFIYGYRPLGYSQGNGMYPREAIKTLQKIGDVPKDRFDYNREMPEIKNLLDNQLSSLKILAEIYQIKSYARIYSKDDICKCIFNDTLVPISIPVYNDLKYDKNNYIISTSDSSIIQGYHMVVIYGYNEKGWLIQNSWGKDWANNGKAILPYDYPIDTAWAIDTENNNVFTYTTITQKIARIVSKIIKELIKFLRRENKNVK